MRIPILDKNKTVIRRRAVAQRSPGASRPVGAPLYGVYYPRTNLCVSDMGARGTGKPPDVEWIDPEPAI